MWAIQYRLLHIHKVHKKVIHVLLDQSAHTNAQSGLSSTALQATASLFVIAVNKCIS